MPMSASNCVGGPTAPPPTRFCRYAAAMRCPRSTLQLDLGGATFLLHRQMPSRQHPLVRAFMPLRASQGFTTLSAAQADRTLPFFTTTHGFQHNINCLSSTATGLPVFSLLGGGLPACGYAPAPRARGKNDGRNDDVDESPRLTIYAVCVCAILYLHAAIALTSRLLGSQALISLKTCAAFGGISLLEVWQ